MREIAVRPVLWTALAIALVVAAAVGAVLGFLHLRHVPAGGERLSSGPDIRLDAPGLSSAPQDELQRDRQAKLAKLNSAGWVDRERGIAHIPISDAMALMAARGSGEPKR
ncbi:hypothetical protein [Ramlibacter humi]|uniref:Uncharacterized protein n=1 Tax=Ramlibacter humi TaxID=2530451 RepID=A0A4Z0BD62_9BURK|nr:hypothetical protein [Ramlibacter humi]TFY97202.1 hypothetical protein EZ216_19175 [Ramlibacter humi]